MSESQRPNHFQIGLEVNKVVTAKIHKDGKKHDAAIKKVAELLARGGTQAITVFSKIQNEK